MRQFDLSPLYRSTVGFDRIFSMLDQMGAPEGTNAYPPYNIERTGENAYRISIAVAGFTDRDLAIEVKENSLAVRGERKGNGDARNTEVLYQGIAARTFERRLAADPEARPPEQALDRGRISSLHGWLQSA